MYFLEEGVESYFNKKDLFSDDTGGKTDAVNQPNLLVQLIKIVFMSLYFVSIYTGFRCEQSYTISKSMTNLFERWPINVAGSLYADVKNKATINQFIYNSILSQIFNEDIKDYYPLEDGYHYRIWCCLVPSYTANTFPN